MEVFRQELPAYPLRAVFDEAAESLGDQALAELLAEVGVERKALEDPLVWVSLEFVEWLFETIGARLDDRHFVDRAAARSMDPKYIGPLHTLLCTFGTPSFTYRRLPKAVRRLNKLASWELAELGACSIRLVWVPTPGLPRERTRALCSFRRAQLARIPTLFSHPAAHVEHSECMLNGHATCVYHVTWTESQPTRHAVLGLAFGLVAGAALAATQVLPWWFAVTIVAAFGLGGAALGRAMTLEQSVRERRREIDEHNRALDGLMRANEQRYAELLEAKAEVDRKVEQRTSELEQTTRRLSETLAEVRALDRAKTDFFNNVSHELRTPLTLILAPLEELIAGRTPPGGERAAFEAMYRSASRLLRLINQLLDLAKVDAGQAHVRLTAVDAPAMLRGIVQGFEAAAKTKGVLLKVQVPAEMRPVALDLGWIESAVTNLLVNALRHTPRGGTVRVVARDLGSEWTLAVSDDGPGIAPEDREKIFERFAQGDSSKRVFGGTGIGLALVREAVRLHGGAVKLASELGKGSTFTLVLPHRSEGVFAESTTAAPASPPQQLVHLANADFKDAPEVVELAGPTPGAPLVLVVEDNPELREFIANVLSVGYRVCAAHDGVTGLALARELRPSVIVSDIAMPGMDGYELCRALRAEDTTRAIPVLLVTARSEVASVLEGFDAGANDYVLKPFHGRELIARVDVHCRLSRMMQELALRERHAMLGVLAASVAHQVRNPLTTLMSGLPAMRTRLASTVDESTRQLIDVMLDCARRIERTTNDLMDLSRVDREAGGNFRPSDGLESAVRLAKGRVGSNIAIEDQVEPCVETYGRAADMNHVFLNVIDNALRAAGTNGRVRIQAATEDDFYVVRIGDSGPGVPDEMKEQIFEPFFTTRPPGEGTGLGLAIATQVLQRCGGAIELGRSELGGALFTIRVPIVPRRPSLSPGEIMMSRTPNPAAF